MPLNHIVRFNLVKPNNGICHLLNQGDTNDNICHYAASRWPSARRDSRTTLLQHLSWTMCDVALRATRVKTKSRDYNVYCLLFFRWNIKENTSSIFSSSAARRLPCSLTKEKISQVRALWLGAKGSRSSCLVHLPYGDVLLTSFNLMIGNCVLGKDDSIETLS